MQMGVFSEYIADFIEQSISIPPSYMESIKIALFE